MLSRSSHNPAEVVKYGSDDAEWTGRSDFWSKFRAPSNRGRPRKYNFRQPLILTGHGVKVRIDHGTLQIQNGFTHYPQERGVFRFFPGDPNLPDRIVLLDGSGGISFDALAWMAEQKVEFLKLDWRGEVSSFGGISGYSANPKLVEIQRKIIGTKKQFEIGRELISEKVSASISTLQNQFPRSEIRKNAIIRLRGWHAEILSPQKTNSIPKLLGAEGNAAAAYFRAWHGIPLNWRGTVRKPIPESWHEIGSRKMAWRKRMRNAQHPINAMLNYGYGILKHEVRRQTIAAGLDPSIGILHGNSQNRIPLVYDLMEPLRPLVDQRILEFALSNEFAPADFSINKWGGCRLNPQMAGVLAKELLFAGAQFRYFQGRLSCFRSPKYDCESKSEEVAKSAR